MISTIERTLKRIFKGKDGELEVLEAISNILKEKEFGNPSFLILNRITIPDITASKEIDLLLLHPVLGIYVIEVKNWNSLKYLLNNKSNPFRSVKEKADLLKTFINESLKTLPINIEYRVIFPSVSSEEGEKFFKEHPSYKRYKNHTFFRDDLVDKEKFQRFFNSSTNIVPTKEQFINVTKLLVGEKKIKENIIPILSRGKISFFDYKQLSVLNGYTGGFKIIRGVAGTGKTAILINFIVNKPEEKILVLCFNKRLRETIVEELKKLKKYNKNVHVYSLFEFLKIINFSSIDSKKSIKENYTTFETKKAIDDFRNRLKEYLSSNPISIFLCDETQDMPPGFMRVILEEIKNCIFFIDEGQKFYPYTMNSIKDVFYHPKFDKKISMRGRVKNLKTIYRTPSNLAKCALEILSLDKNINAYYKQAKYVKNNLLSDVSYVLEEGEIFVGNFNNFDTIIKILQEFAQNKKTYVLTYTTKIADGINKLIKRENISNAKALPLQAVKGLEADNIIIHSFDYFLMKNFENPEEKEIIYRKIYVLMTRAREKLFLSVNEDSYPKIEKIRELNEIFTIIRKYSKLYNPERLTLPSPKNVNNNNKENKKFHPHIDFQLIKDIAELTNAIIGITGYLLK